jgi:hypothetical protein
VRPLVVWNAVILNGAGHTTVTGRSHGPNLERGQSNFPKKGADSGGSPKESNLYSAGGQNDSAVMELGDDTLKMIARVFVGRRCPAQRHG